MSMSALRLAENGDSLEQLWASVILADLPDYEPLWQRHIVPLTFRESPDPDVRCRFVRPGLKDVFRDLADAHYATFHHLAHCHAWIGHIRELDGAGPERIRKFPSPSESLYCFLAHAISANDAMLYFVTAVNRVLLRYALPEYFRIDFVPREPPLEPIPHRLRSTFPGLPLDSYDVHIVTLKRLRNQLLHEHPVFIHNTRMPLPAKFRRYSGLSGIGHVALDPSRLESEFQPMAEYSEKLLRGLTRRLQPIWHAALGQLDSIPPAKYHVERSQYTLIDRKLRSSDFEAVRRMGGERAQRGRRA